MTKLQVGCDKSSVSDPVFFTNPDPGSRGKREKLIIFPVLNIITMKKILFFLQISVASLSDTRKRYATSSMLRPADNIFPIKMP